MEIEVGYISFESPGRAVLRRTALNGEPGPDEVLVRNEFSAVSAGTERAWCMGEPNTSQKFPQSPGYSSTGRVEAVGSAVETLRPGDRVVVGWGGHRSHTVKQAAKLVKIADDSIDSAEASFAHIASFPLLGVRKLRVETGEAVMVAGLGLLGLFSVQFARLSGAIPVLAADFDPKRRELARQLGADRVFDPGAPDFTRQVLDATDGKGPAAVVEVTGSAAALRQALEYAGYLGRIALLGCTRVSDEPIDFYKYVHRRGVSLIGAHTMTRPEHDSAPGAWTEQDDYRAFLKLLGAGRLSVRPMISETVPPEEAPEVYSRLASEKNPPLGFVFDWRNFR